MIFSDPEYAKPEQYLWLAQTAARVLKPNAPLLVYVGLGYFTETMDALRAGGWRHRWSLHGVYPNLKTWGWGKLMITQTVVWWMERETERMTSPIYHAVADMTMLPYDRDVRYLQQTGASWDKHPKQVKLYCQGFCRPGGVILDPFAGTGQIPVYGRVLGFDVAGFEVKKDLAEKGCARLNNLPPAMLDQGDPQPELMEVERGKRKRR